MIWALPVLVNYLMFRGAISAVVGLATGFQKARIAVTRFTLAWKVMGVAGRANVIGIVATAIAALVSWLAVATSATEKFVDKQAEANKMLNNLEGSIGKVQSEAKRYYDAINLAAKGTKERAAAIKNFQDKFGMYYSTMLTEKSTAEEIAEAYKKVNDELRNKQVLEAYQKQMEAKVDTRAGWANRKLDIYNRASDLSNKANQYNGLWLREYTEDALSKGKQLRDIINDLATKFGVSQKVADIAFNERGKEHSAGYATPQRMKSGEVISGVYNFTQEDKMLQLAADYIAQQAVVVNARRDVEKSFESYKDIIHPNVKIESPGTLDNEAPDKEALAEARRRRNEQNQAWRQELKDMEAQAKAIMDNVRNFYDRQIATETDKAVAAGMTEAQRNIMLEPMKARLNDALKSVRLALAGQPSDWEEFKQGIKNDMKEQVEDGGYNYSEYLLEEILAADPKLITSKITELSNNLKLPLNKTMASIFKSATSSEKANSTLRANQSDRRRKSQLDNDYIGQVQSKYVDMFDEMGFSNPDRELSINDYKQRTEEIIAMFESARENIAKVFKSDGDKLTLMEILFGKDWAYTVNGSHLRGVLSLMGDDMRLFYEKLLSYSTEYAEAEKRNTDRIKKTLSDRWSRSDEGRAFASRETKLTQASKGKKIVGGSFWESTGLVNNLNEDPEILLSMARMEQKQKELEFYQQVTDDEKILNDAQLEVNKANMEFMNTVADKTRQRIADVQKFISPINSFAKSVGKAFGSMGDDVESAQDAMKTAVVDLVQTMGEMYIELITQQITQRLVLSAVKRSADAGDAASSVTTAGIQVAAGIAAGSAKTIASLGWWGIPLIAGITAILNGLLSFATSKLSSAFGLNSKSSAATATSPTFRLTQGVLTYDAGNVTDVLGSDGRVYRAANGGVPDVGIVSQPTLTTVNGRPGLIGEVGPELVVGRVATRQLAFDHPEVLRTILSYSRHHTPQVIPTFDEGNLGNAPTSVGNGQISEKVLESLSMAVAALTEQLKHPIEAKINKYGRGGLIEEVKSGLKFDERH